MLSRLRSLTQQLRLDLYSNTSHPLVCGCQQLSGRCEKRPVFMLGVRPKRWPGFVRLKTALARCTGSLRTFISKLIRGAVGC